MDDAVVAAPLPSGFGVSLRRWRQAKGLSLRAAAARLEVAFSYLQKLETGGRARPPSIALLQRMVPVYGLSPASVAAAVRGEVLDAPPGRHPVDRAFALLMTHPALRPEGVDPGWLDSYSLRQKRQLVEFAQKLRTHHLEQGPQYLAPEGTVTLPTITAQVGTHLRGTDADGCGRSRLLEAPSPPTGARMSEHHEPVPQTDRPTSRPHVRLEQFARQRWGAADDDDGAPTPVPAVLVGANVLETQDRLLQVLAVELGDAAAAPGDFRQTRPGRWVDSFGELVVERVSLGNGPNGYEWTWWPQGCDEPVQRGYADFALSAMEHLLAVQGLARGAGSVSLVAAPGGS